MKLNSGFAILDVKGGRAELKRRVEAGETFAVVIEGVIDAVHSQDDGVSREFSITVKTVEVTELGR